MSEPPTALMIVIDQLPASLLGPYGNTLIETECFNALAAESLLFDFTFADSVDLSEALKRIWFPVEPNLADQKSVLSLPPTSQVETVLITDDPRVANHPLAHFDRILLIDQPDVLSAAKEIADTQLVNFFAEVAAWLSSEWESGQLCWVHSRGLAGAWDAPYWLRQRFAGEDDPNPPRFTDLSEVTIDRTAVDPDQQLGFQQAAAAQITVLDQCLGILWHVWQTKLAELNPLIGLTSLRGCGLGEHGELAAGKELHSALHAEMVQVPLMIRFPTVSSPADARRWPVGRSSRMVSTSDLGQLLAAWLQQQWDLVDGLLANLDSVFPAGSRDLVILSSDRQQMIQTPAWKLLRDLEGNVELYAKPDDRWEISDVSDRCPQIVEQLIVWLDRLDHQPPANDGNTTIYRDVSVVDELVERWD